MAAVPAIASLARRCLVVLALFVVAVLYFRQGITANLELTDEGCIIYPIWRVSEGAIPYRDFRQLYGPSLFFVNAALFRLFGTDLLVIRLSLVALKALVAVLVYLLARRVAGGVFALIAYLLCVTVWGVPWWMLNSPYASHWAIALNLAALLAFLSLSEKPRIGGFLAGALFGLSATFKQTTGVFGLTALLVFLASEARVPSPTDGRPSRMAGLIRAATVLGAIGLCVAYLGPHLDSWSTLMLLAPIVATLTTRTLVAVRVGIWSRASLASVVVMGCAVVGMLLPVLAYGAFYAGHGSLAAVADNLVYGLPQRISRFVPLPSWGVRRPEWFSLQDPAGPQLRTVLSGLMVVSAFTAIRWWQSAHVPGHRLQRLGYRLAVGTCLAAVALWLGDLSQAGGFTRYIRDGQWLAEVNRLFFWIPLLLVWGSFASVSQMQAGGGATDGRREQSFRLLHLHATIGLLQLYPSADLWHVLMIFPIFLPLLAYELDWARDAQADAAWSFPGRALPAALATALLVWLALPFVNGLVLMKAHRPASVPVFSRATDIWDARDKIGEAAALVSYLRQATPADQLLLVLPSEPALYFLAERVSALDNEEYTLYLIGTKLMSGKDARELLDQDRIVARLEAARPLVVDYVGSPATARFVETLPQVATYIRSHYRLVKVIGNYQVLQWAGT